MEKVVGQISGLMAALAAVEGVVHLLLEQAAQATHQALHHLRATTVAPAQRDLELAVVVVAPLKMVLEALLLVVAAEMALHHLFLDRQ